MKKSAQMVTDLLGRGVWQLSVIEVDPFKLIAEQFFSVKMPSSEKQTSCRLASDLLKMYTEGIDTDVVVRTQNGDLFAHKSLFYTYL